MVDGLKTSWQLVIFGITHGSLGGPIQFIISIFAFDIKLGEGEVSAMEVRLPFRGEPRQKEELDDNKLRRLNRDKCKLWYLRWSSPVHHYNLGTTLLETNFVVKGLEVFCLAVSWI